MSAAINRLALALALALWCAPLSYWFARWRANK